MTVTTSINSTYETQYSAIHLTNARQPRRETRLLAGIQKLWVSLGQNAKQPGGVTGMFPAENKTLTFSGMLGSSLVSGTVKKEC